MMTASAGNDPTLFTFEGAAAVAKTNPRRGRKKQEVAATTPSGENSGDIIAAWIAACQERTGVPVPQSVIKRLSRQVKSLVHSGYQTNHIKNGLLIWTVRWMDNPLTSPEQLDRLTWKLVMDQSPEGRRFQAELKEAVYRFNGQSSALPGGATKKQQRDIDNTQGKLGWRERYAERKRMEDGT